MTNAERQKKFRERQLLNNKDEYLYTQSQYKKKQYRKKYKDGELENEDEINEEITKEFVLVVFFLDKNLELIYDEGLVKARSSIRIMY